MKQIKIIIIDIYNIYTKKHLRFIQKNRLFVSYLLIRWKRFCSGRLLSRFVNLNQQRFLGFSINFDNYSDFFWTFREIFINDDYYFHTENESPFIVDCGGNIGMSVLYFKYLYPKAKIIVFEALPENARILIKNIELNKLKDVQVVAKAVGGVRGELKISGEGRAATINKDIKNSRSKTDVEYKDKVPVVKLSEYIKDDIDFLKMDIEGVESEVINELSESNTLQKIMRITMEYHSVNGNSNLLSRILDNLENGCFRVSFVNNTTNVTGLDIRSFSHIMLVAFNNNYE